MNSPLAPAERVAARFRMWQRDRDKGGGSLLQPVPAWAVCRAGVAFGKRLRPCRGPRTALIALQTETIKDRCSLPR